MYASSQFTQNYGWYENLRLYQDGYEEELQKVCEKQRMYSTDPALEMPENLKNKKEEIINELRNDLGYKNIGEAWIRETTIFNIVKDIFPKYKVVLHYKPKFLEGMELDIFIKELNLGIEHQGQQHFEPIKHWGGEEGLKEVQQRDKLKAGLCKKNKVNLLYINYDEEITKEKVHEKIKHFLG